MVDSTFGKSHRLLSASDFESLKSNRQVFRTPEFVAYYRPSGKDTGHTRIGFSISRKLGKSHQRNRIRRVLKEAFRQGPYKILGLDVLFALSPKFGDIWREDQERAEKGLLISYISFLNYLQKRVQK